VRYIWAVCLLGLISSPLRAETTVKEYREAEAAGGIRWQAMRYYIDGFASGMQWASVYAGNRGKNLYCSPGNLHLDVGNFIGVLNDEIAFRTKRDGKPVSDDEVIEGLLFFGTLRTFPCESK
jgi:hypothetical protein